MRCIACNQELSNREATRKDDNGDYYDLCSECLTVSYSATNEDAYKWDIGLDSEENT